MLISESGAISGFYGQTSWAPDQIEAHVFGLVTASQMASESLQSFLNCAYTDRQ